MTQFQNWQDGVTVLTAAWANGVEQTCQTVSQLRSFNGSSGCQQVYVEGIGAVNDGGQGAFYWNATASGVTDDDLNTIVPNGATVGCWSRLSYGATLVSTQTATSGTSTSLSSAINTQFVNVAAPFTVNLPVAPFLGEWHRVKDSGGNGATDNITISPNVDGAQLKITTNYGHVTVQWNGTAWGSA